MDKQKKEKINNVIFLALPIVLLCIGIYFRVRTPQDFLPDIAICIASYWLGFKTSEYLRS